MTKRVSVPTNDATREDLEKYAEEHGISVGQAGKEMIALGLTVEEIRQESNIMLSDEKGERIIGGPDGMYINDRYRRR